MLTMLTNVFNLITAVDAVSDGVAEGILWQTLPTPAPVAAVIARNALIAAGFITAVRTFPFTVADG